MHLGADRVTDVLAHDREPRRFRDLLHRAADLVEPLTDDELVDPRPERTFGHLEESFRGRTHLADRCGVGGVTVVALDDRARVDRDDVALFEHVRARDPVDDHVVRTRADDRGESVVVEEVRARVALGQDVGRQVVEVHRGDPGTDGVAGHLVDLGDDPSGLAHLVQLVLRADHVSPRPCSNSSISAATFSTAWSPLTLTRIPRDS